MRCSLLTLTIALAAGMAQGADCLTKEEAAEGFKCLFDGKTLQGWQGAVKGYKAADGSLVCEKTGGGVLTTDKEYADFIFRFDFKFEPGGNNGVGIRMPKTGNAAYVAMEIQILDDSHAKYKGWLKDYQHHGSIYGVVPAKTGFLKPAGEWNSEEILCKGRQVKVTLNGHVIVDANLDQVKPLDGQAHPGLKNTKGFIGFLGHGDRMDFRKIRLKELK